MRYILAIIFLLFSFWGTTQQNQDFGIWVGGEFSKKINKQFDVESSLGIRTDDNSTHIKQFFYEIGGTFKISKELKTTLKYRNRFGFDYTGKTINNRFIWDIAYKFKFETIGLQLRNRLQKNFAPEGRNKVLERIRVKVDFKLQKGLKAYAYNELFYDLNSDRGIIFDSNRWGFGMKYEIQKDFEITLSYIRQRDYSSFVPFAFNGIQLETTIEF